jgi:hypothetical protein
MQRKMFFGIGLALAIVFTIALKSRHAAEPETTPVAPRGVKAAVAPAAPRIEPVAAVPVKAAPAPMAKKIEETEAPDGNSRMLDRAKALIDAGKPADALVLLKKAVEADPENFVAAAELGFAYSTFGQPEKAKHTIISRTRSTSTATRKTRKRPTATRSKRTRSSSPVA